MLFRSETFTLGDDAANRQYRAILHFNTASLPDNAVITKATLKILERGQTGMNPFTVLGWLRADIRRPFFGASIQLAISDFEAAGTSSVTTFNKAPSGNWFSAILNAGGRSGINRTGSTQFRLYFTSDDNNNRVADNMKFFSGETANASARPILIVEYDVP